MLLHDNIIFTKVPWHFLAVSWHNVTIEYQLFAKNVSVYRRILGVLKLNELSEQLVNNAS